MNAIIEKLYPRVKETIKTDLTPIAVMQKLSEVVKDPKSFDGSFFNHDGKPFKGELKNMEFKIRAASTEEWPIVYTKGKIIKNHNGCTIEMTVGHEGKEIILLFLVNVCGFLYAEFKTCQCIDFNVFQGPLPIFLLVMLFIYGIFVGSIKQELRKQLKFIGSIILTKESFDISAYNRQKRKSMFRWAVIIIIVCPIFALLVTALYGVLFIPELKLKLLELMTGINAK